VSADEGLTLFMEAPFGNLLAAAHSRRMQLHPEPVVTWIIDRNVNISNVCHAGCLFCNFSCSRSSSRAYITTSEEYHDKIRELFSLGGNQLLLQGGLHPDLGLQYYEKLFSGLKKDFPELRLHALGPPEIVHLAKMEGISYGEVLEILQKAGLDSLPGAGAEILSDRVRKMLSPGKCSVSEWLQVMQEAHQRHITTSATMMFGHVETLEERFQHLILLRETQALKPEQSKGFISFIPWPFQDEGTALSRKLGVFNQVSAEEYIRFIAVSRLMLHNIPNLQPSWLTVGIPVAQICLHAGANDFGSVMIEEHVVSSAGASYSADSQTLVKAIRAAGFIPARRNQDFEHLI
ncbi:MAG TPA: CofH family radical SAM protein, partial [Bacteroidales bacterium]|nr:CofH family radical SAM protein [Bacteroidales bacterium]